MSESPWATDFRWRRVRVSSQLLSAWLCGGYQEPKLTTAPPDLVVIGLTEVRTGPAGWYEFMVWSATFDPVPNNGTLPDAPIPLIEIEYAL